MQSPIQSTCCSIETTMLLSTDGLPGPVTMNRFGKPATATPRYVRGPVRPVLAQAPSLRPRMSMSSSAPVMASNPIAKTMQSTSYSAGAGPHAVPA